jgi:methyl-accepting chemotaxis protein
MHSQRIERIWVNTGEETRLFLSTGKRSKTENEVIEVQKDAVWEKKKSTMRKKIVTAVAGVVVGISAAYIVFSIVMVNKSTRDCLEHSMPATAAAAAQTVESTVNKYTSLAEEIADNSTLYGETSTDDDKIAYLRSKCKNSADFVGINYYTTDGTLVSDGGNYSSSEFFTEAKSGVTYISFPETDTSTGDLVFNLSTPVWKDGSSSSSVIGIVKFLVKQSVLNSVAENIKVSGGSSYIIGKNGTVIAGSDISLVNDKENVSEEKKTDSSPAGPAAVYSEAAAGKSGFGQYTYKGNIEFIAYASISGTDGWSVCITVPKKTFARSVTETKYFAAALFLILAFFSLIPTLIMTRLLASQIVTVMTRLSAFAEGDVTSPISVETTNFELESLKKSLIRTTGYTSAVISDIDYLLTEMSGGNFDILSKTPDKYIGDYEHILVCFRILKKSLNESFGCIAQVSGQVLASSSQVSVGAQSLAQGATEQASSIQELSASVAEVSQRVKSNAEDAEKAKELSSKAGEAMQNSALNMERARQAMNEISVTSKDISKVIKAIDDIAFQTNILALNAAVEAARAGTAGKGFAVVADEVRNLSQKSSEAAKNTTALIESSIAAVEKGTLLVNETYDSFTEAESETEEVGNLVQNISAQAQEQSAAISQISIGMDQISSVVQMNSATSEESAAASEELSSQAAMLRELIRRFRLTEMD